MNSLLAEVFVITILLMFGMFIIELPVSGMDVKSHGLILGVFCNPLVILVISCLSCLLQELVTEIRSLYLSTKSFLLPLTDLLLM